MSDNIKPTPESIEAAQGIISRVLDDPECPLGWRLVQAIAEHLTRNDRELTRWLNQEIREKTGHLGRSFVVEAERRMDAQLKVDELESEIEGLKERVDRYYDALYRIDFCGADWPEAAKIAREAIADAH